MYHEKRLQRYCFFLNCANFFVFFCKKFFHSEFLLYLCAVYNAHMYVSGVRVC